MLHPFVNHVRLMPRLLDICRIDVFYYLHTKGSGHAVVTVDAHWPVHPCALVLQFVHILYVICPVHPCALVLGEAGADVAAWGLGARGPAARPSLLPHSSTATNFVLRFLVLDLFVLTYALLLPLVFLFLVWHHFRRLPKQQLIDLKTWTRRDP